MHTRVRGSGFPRIHRDIANAEGRACVTDGQLLISSTERQFEFDYPACVTLDDDDNIYVELQWTIVITAVSDWRFVAQSFLQFKWPSGIGFNTTNGKLSVFDSDNYRIYPRNRLSPC